MLHHANASAHTSLLVLNFLANNNTVFTRLGPLLLFPISKTEETHERTEICYEERFCRKSPILYQKVLIRSASRIAKNVLYLRGTTLKGQYRYWWRNKYFSRKIKIHLIFWTTYVKLERLKYSSAPNNTPISLKRIMAKENLQLKLNFKTNNGERDSTIKTDI